jgi:hypothetical protein
MIEITGNPAIAGSPAHEVIRLMQENGYKQYWFDGNRLHSTIRQGTVTNYFFLRDEHERVILNNNPSLYSQS